MKIKCGCPHFSGELRKYRSSDINLESGLREFIDNIVNKATEIRIYLQVDDSGQLTEICIHDNYDKGFTDLLTEGDRNPFNLAHQ